MIRYFVLGAYLSLALPVGAIAQDAPYDPEPTMTCVAEALELADKRACVGTSAEICAEASMGGFNTRSMTICMTFEYNLFDQMLNDEYVIVRDLARGLDAQENGTSFDEVSMENRLIQMQRAWITFRDATCAYEQRQFDGGTLGQLIHADCLATLTADQTFRLQNSVLEL